MKYSQSHEWIRLEEGIGVVGVTDYAQKELGNIVYVELPPVGKKVKAGEEVAVLESTKAAADIYTPVTGEIVEINQKLHDFVHRINEVPEGEGWLFKIQIEKPQELDTLLTPTGYQQLINPVS